MLDFIILFQCDKEKWRRIALLFFSFLIFYKKGNNIIRITKIIDAFYFNLSKFLFLFHKTSVAKKFPFEVHQISLRKSFF